MDGELNKFKNDELKRIYELFKNAIKPNEK